MGTNAGGSLSFGGGNGSDGGGSDMRVMGCVTVVVVGMVVVAFVVNIADEMFVCVAGVVVAVEVAVKVVDVVLGLRPGVLPKANIRLKLPPI